VDKVGNNSNSEELVARIDAKISSKKFQIVNSKGNLLSPSSPLVMSRFNEMPAVKDIFVKFESNPKTILKPFQGTALDIALLEKQERQEKQKEKASETDDIIITAIEASVDLDEYFTEYVDQEPPYVVGTVSNDQHLTSSTVYISTRSKINLDAQDNHLGVEQVWYQFKGGKKQTYTEPFHVPVKSGYHTISFHAVDKGKNSSKPKELQVYLDQTPPKTAFSLSQKPFNRGSEIFINGETSFSLTGDDKESGVKTIKYAIDKGESLVFIKPVLPTDSGIHEIRYYTVDHVNNQEAENKYKFFVDKAEPTLFLYFNGPPLKTIPEEEKTKDVMYYPLNSVLFLAASDQDAGIKSIFFKLNDGKLKKYIKPIQFKEKGKHLFYVEATDAVGNTIRQHYNIMIL